MFQDITRWPGPRRVSRLAQYSQAMLIVMSGLPGTGKSALASRISKRTQIPIVSVDPIEAAIWRSGIDKNQPTGLAAYEVAKAIAGEQLALGLSVIIDAVNAVEAARQ